MRQYPDHLIIDHCLVVAGAISIPLNPRGYVVTHNLFIGSEHPVKSLLWKLAKAAPWKIQLAAFLLRWL